jgi:hypothetical protein
VGRAAVELQETVQPVLVELVLLYKVTMVEPVLPMAHGARVAEVVVLLLQAQQVHQHQAVLVAQDLLVI